MGSRAHYVVKKDGSWARRYTQFGGYAMELDLPSRVSERITGCTDLARLEAWARRAGVVTTAAELFE
jgi:hypothetical protein